MKIITQNVNNDYLNKNKNSKKNTFRAHPDFKKLTQDSNIVVSSFFRRGTKYGSPSIHFIDIIILFKNFFQKNKVNKMLIGGIGESQEPFSYLATIKSLFQDKKLKDMLDLKTVDLQSKPTKEELFKHSYFEYHWEPNFAQSSFVRDVRSDMKYKFADSYYRVNDEIFEFLDDTYNKKSLWDTRLQDAIKTFPDNEFDFVSINNTLYYISDQNSRIDTLKNIYRTLKKGGVFITDTTNNFIEEAKLSKSFFKIADGIFRKL